jgi:hypothetical protein
VNPRPDLPAFARDFPEEPRLDALVQAFVDGDYARVRRDVPELVKTAESEDVKRAASELVRRTKADPLMIWLLVLTGVLLMALSAYWVARAGGPG